MAPWDEAEVRNALDALARAQGQSESQVEAYVELELSRLRRKRAEGYPQGQAEAFTTPDDPSVFGRFDFVDLVAGREWRVMGHLATSADGALLVRAIEVRPWPHIEGRRPPEGYDVTSTVLRGLRLAAIRDRAARQLRETNAEIAIADQVDWPAPATVDRQSISRAAANAAAAVPKPGPDGFGDEFYRRLAIRYLALLGERTRANRSTRGIIGDLALEFGLARTQTRDAVATARNREWLTRGTAGRAGAGPGRRLLSEEKEDA